jgi:hypothetical protein
MLGHIIPLGVRAIGGAVVAATQLPVEYLFTMTAHLAAPLSVGAGPQGPRVIHGVTGGTFEGPKLRGTLEPVGGDWVTSRPDGSVKLDVRVTLRTEDGALILMTYNGIAVRREGQLAIRTAPLFETGDERYTWLNDVQAVGVGTGVPGTPPAVRYEVYAIR